MTSSPNVMDVKEVQSPKARSPIEVTLFGMMIDVKAEQPEKTPRLIVLILSGSVTDSRDVHSWKAHSPIETILFGITN